MKDPTTFDKLKAGLATMVGSTALTPIFTAKTPFSEVPEVSLLHDTWNNHILRGHPEMAGKEHLVHAALTSPTFVVQGTSNPSYVIFVNHDETSQRGNPLTVVVNPEAKIIVTSLYHRSFKTVTTETIKWQR